MSFLTIGFLALTLSFSSFASVTKLCVITTDAEPELTDFLIETNEKGDLDSIRLYTTLDSKVVSDESFTAESAIIEGVVASEREGREVVVLRPKNFNASTGGIIALDYLYNGLSGARKVFNIKLSKVAGKFILTTTEGIKINRLEFLVNKVMGRVIGIKEVRTSFK